MQIRQLLQHHNMDQKVKYFMADNNTDFYNWDSIMNILRMIVPDIMVTHTQELSFPLKETRRAHKIYTS